MPIVWVVLHVFANHSCSPNCEFQKWTVDGLQRMCMFSLRTIKPGEELTYDYNFQCFNLQAQQPCYCESVKCRGTIGAKQPKTTNNNQGGANQRLSQKEKRMVLQSSIFLLRNLRKIKELKTKNKNLFKHQNDKQSGLALFFPQNFYHHKSALTSLRKTPKFNRKGISLLQSTSFYSFFVFRCFLFIL